MDSCGGALSRQRLAEQIADGLADAAERLHDAHDLEQFIAALDAHRQVWRSVSMAASTVGWLVPEQLVEFSLSSAGRADGHLNDHEIEALIRINRFAASALAKAHAESASGVEA